MNGIGSHPILAQVPLTVSPFINLPTATTLPYTYKALPSTLPASSTGDANGAEKPRYVTSSSGVAAHPDDIITTCKALQSHLQSLQDDAEKMLREWEEIIRQRELAEKRRVAPGWLDRDEKILQPERKGSASRSQDSNLLDRQDVRPGDMSVGPLSEDKEGEQLDMAFGGLGIK